LRVSSWFTQTCSSRRGQSRVSFKYTFWDRVSGEENKQPRCRMLHEVSLCSLMDLWFLRTVWDDLTCQWRVRFIYFEDFGNDPLIDECCSHLGNLHHERVAKWIASHHWQLATASKWLARRATKRPKGRSPTIRSLPQTPATRGWTGPHLPKTGHDQRWDNRRSARIAFSPRYASPCSRVR